MEEEREFRVLFEESKLEQKQLAGLLGVAPLTVNRWLTTRPDRVAPPFYAMNFLRAFLMLPKNARGSLPMKFMEKPIKKAAA